MTSKLRYFWGRTAKQQLLPPPHLWALENTDVVLVKLYHYNNGLCTAYMLLYGKRQSEKSPPEKKTPQNLRVVIAQHED